MLHTVALHMNCMLQSITSYHSCHIAAKAQSDVPPTN